MVHTGRVLPRPRALSNTYLEQDRDLVSRPASKGSALNSPVSKQVCRCGTTVLFPAQVNSRTCWNCGTQLQLESPCQGEKRCGLPPSPAPSTSSTASTVQRPAGLPKEADSDRMDGNPGKVAVTMTVPGRSGAALYFVAGLLIASLVVNAALYSETHGMAVREQAAVEQMRSANLQDARDTDGDGVPDQDDFCPGKRPKPGERAVWISGRASDFDGDGCEDGVEDQDRDNDGIEDKVDRCPFSPKQYNFVSDSVNDFDGDGCKDGVEDQDDDGDGVPNDEDACKRTRPGESSDISGCSKEQHRDLELAREQAEQSPPSAPSVPSVISEWVGVLRSAWLEVLLGALITPILTTAKELLEWLRGRMAAAASPPSKEKASTKGRALQSLLLRALLYILFFCGVYAWRSFGGALVA
ncbi:unnamed protein product [Durusdinium trenchii]|uniref:Uncharacterized protein n=2 Tax=Durusdinium trenchii TaxID=1381693 RepID=A0ABP0IG29_9DINO